jgi:hypothetical protein
MSIRTAITLVFFALASISSVHAGHEACDSHGEGHECFSQRFFAATARPKTDLPRILPAIAGIIMPAVRVDLIRHYLHAVPDPAHSSPITLHQLLTI